MSDQLFFPSGKSTLPKLHLIMKWKPVYDLIVAGHIIGRQNKELAEQFDYTEVRISQILNSEQARAIIAHAQKQIRQKAEEDITEMEEVQKRIQQKALQRVENFLDRADLADASPFTYISTIKDFAKSAPVVKTPAVSVQVNNTNVQATQNISNTSLERLTKALEISEGLEVSSE